VQTTPGSRASLGNVAGCSVCGESRGGNTGIREEHIRLRGICHKHIAKRKKREEKRLGGGCPDRGTRGLKLLPAINFYLFGRLAGWSCRS